MLHRLFNVKYQIYWIALGVAFLLTIPISFLLPDFTAYSVKLVAKERVPANCVITYHDLDFDGKSEKIEFIKDFMGTPAILVESGGKLLYQKNFKGEFVKGSFFCVDDCNADERCEILCLTTQNDSVFLHIVEGITGDFKTKELFVTTFQKHAGNPDYGIYFPAMEDLDNDGYKEVILPFMCGFTAATRKVCIYDIFHKKLKTSPLSGTAIGRNMYYADIDNDGKKELMGSSDAYDNCDEEYPFSDHFAWLMVLNSEARFLFDPIKIGSYSTTVGTCPLFDENGQAALAVFSKHIGNSGDTSFLGLYNAKGEVLRKKMIPYQQNLRNATLYVNYPADYPQELIIYREDGLLETYNQNLELINAEQSVSHNGKLGELDVDGDGAKEYILKDRSNLNYWITRDDFSAPAKLPGLSKFLTGNSYLSVVEPDKNTFSIQNEGDYYTFSYHKNRLYRWRLLTNILLFSSVYGAVYGIGFLFQFFIKRRYETEKKIAQMQLVAIENQLNPHFNLNVLNSIGALYETHEKEKAQYYFGKYNKLLRQSLFQSGQLTVSLTEELEFTKNYLELEKLRMNEGFEYKIVNADHLPEIDIPKMLIHTFVENAIKHGLKHLKGKGLLLIEFMQQANNLKIIISDNGIGREKAKQYSLMSTGKGMEIVNKSLDLFFNTQDIRIEYKINDLYTEAGEAAGTRVEIKVPL
ncbi:sensor histidine kinase [Draconibacterium sp.]|uniref:sensor histidine kinase n=1 Tax=Draconibacterium sp. TaxID=1965318 RepID=UPI003564824B